MASVCDNWDELAVAVKITNQKGVYFTLPLT